MRTLIIALFLFPSIVLGQSVRRVEVDCRALFAFDPLTGRFVAGSLSQVAEYVDQWRASDSIDLRISLKLTPGYTLYQQTEDSTLTLRVLSYFAPYTLCDSVANPVYFSRMPRSRKFDNQFDSDIKQVKSFFANNIAMLFNDQHTDAAYSYYAPSEFSGIFHAFQLQMSGADVSFFAPPSMPSVLKEKIYISDLFEMFRYDNDLVIFRLTGREIKDFLEKSYNRRYYKLRNENSDLLRIRTPYYMHVSAAGISYEFNTVKGQIENLSLSLDTTYSVVANSFMAKQFLAAGENLGDYRCLLVRWMNAVKLIHSQGDEQWQLTPQRWVQKISQREMLLLGPQE